jgi:NADH-quinone oxidoreductase subunit F
MKKITDRIANGRGHPDDVGLLTNIADNIAGRTICAFGEACAWPVQSFVGKFRDEFESHALGSAAPQDRALIQSPSPSKKLEAV